MSHIFSSSSSDDDELLIDWRVEARKRAAPVRDQVPRARRARSSATPSLALRPSVRTSGQAGPILSKLPSTCRLLMRALHDDLVDFLGTSTRPGYESHTIAASIGLAVERLLRPDDETWNSTLDRSKKLHRGERDDDTLNQLSRLLQKYTRLHTVWGYSASGHGHTRYEERMHASHGLYGCSYPVSDVLFRNLARAVEGMSLIESDSVLGVNGNKWEAHAGATAPGQFCAFDTAQGRAVRNFYTDFANEVA